MIDIEKCITHGAFIGMTGGVVVAFPLTALLALCGRKVTCMRLSYISAKGGAIIGASTAAICAIGVNTLLKTLNR